VNDACFAADMRPALVQYFRRRCGNAEEAEDLAQDVLLSMVGRPQWESPEHASGYVFRAAANRWMDRQRRAAVHGIAVEWEKEAAHGLHEEITPECVFS
jgi:DNA-directed RNA polymerase specialized sigma24 family protein